MLRENAQLVSHRPLSSWDACLYRRIDNLDNSKRIAHYQGGRSASVHVHGIHRAIENHQLRHFIEGCSLAIQWLASICNKEDQAGSSLVESNGSTRGCVRIIQAIDRHPVHNYHIISRNRIIRINITQGKTCLAFFGEIDSRFGNFLSVRDSFRHGIAIRGHPITGVWEIVKGSFGPPWGKSIPVNGNLYPRRSDKLGSSARFKRECLPCNPRSN